MQSTLFEFVKEERKEDIVAIDWAINKPIIAYNGDEITSYNSIEEFKKTVNTTILCEEGIPRSLFVMDRDIMLVPGTVVKAKRAELNFDKSDENDAKTIFILYKENSDAFRFLDERSKELELLKKQVKVFSRYEKIKTAGQNMLDSILKEYGSFDDIAKLKILINIATVEKEKAERNIELILKAHFYKERRELDKIKGLSFVLIAKLLAYIGGIERFKSYSKLKSYAGIAPNKGKRKGKDYKYSRELQMTFLGKKHLVDEMIMQRTEPYRSLYDKQKERLKKERPDERPIHIENIVRRKVADKILEDIWKILWECCGKGEPAHD